MGNINKHTVTQTHFIQNGQKRRKKENREQEKIQIQIYQKSHQEEGGSQEEKGQESQENPQGWQEMASLEGYPRKNRWCLRKKDLRKSKSGKIVSKKQSDLAKKRMKKGGISKWLKAVMKARKALKLKGFVACKKGTKYYRTARKFYKK